MKPKFKTRATLARYAGMLVRDSLAACALRYYDAVKEAGGRPKIEMRNNGFSIHTRDGIAHYG